MNLKIFFTFSFLIFTLTSCTPTYPKEKFRESIVRVCRDEYSLDVKVETIGGTIAIYVPLADLLDFNFGITKKAGEQINDVILSVSRVAISSDARYDFYCIIAHDIRMPEIQIVIIKSVDDVKRFMLNDISRGEYSKRMLVDIRLSPQAQKEKAIKDVFQKMSLDARSQEDVINSFFRSEPAALGDIGYWDGRFFIKDISLPEFLAEQIANRIKMEFRDNKNLADNFSLKSAKGRYYDKGDKKYFRFEVLAEPKWFKEFEKEEVSNRIFEETARIAADALHGYRFAGFDYAEISSQFDAKALKVSKEDLEEFRKKKIIFEEILTGNQNG